MRRKFVLVVSHHVLNQQGATFNNVPVLRSLECLPPILYSIGIGITALESIPPVGWEPVDRCLAPYSPQLETCPVPA